MVIRMNALTPVAAADSALLNDAGTHPELALIQRLSANGRQSTAEMLQELRRTFPHSPLAVRVRALEALRKR